MCDYSLQHVASIPAKVGDRLVTTTFTHSTTRGFSAVGSPNVAVCVRPGTELAFDREVHRSGVVRGAPYHGKIAAGVATFRQVNLDQPYMHHDALEFPNGQLVMPTDLAPSQSAIVLQLPADAAPKERHADLGATAPALATG